MQTMPALLYNFFVLWYGFHKELDEKNTKGEVEHPSSHIGHSRIISNI
jgi:hypothetical protein